MSKSSIHYVKLDGSEKHAPRAPKAETLNPNEVINVTVRVRRKASIEEMLGKNQVLTHSEYEKNYGASDEDFRQIESFAGEHHLAVAETSHARRSVILRGKVVDFEQAFRTHLSHYRDYKGVLFRGRTGSISIPQELQGCVEAVIGLDDRPVARPMFKVARNKVDGLFLSHRHSAGFTPVELAKLYGFPSDATGKGQCIAIIELGGGYRATDLRNYFEGLGIKKPSVNAVSVDGAHNHPSTPDSADGEVMLDIEVAGAIAHEAGIVVYFAPNTDQGFLNAITSAIHDTRHKPSVISISWGSAEINWTKQSLHSYNEAFKAASLLGVTICAAAGDQGSGDNVDDGNVHVDFPSSSPYVLACGGTKCLASDNKIVSETAWNESPDSATGGGVSEFFALPSYQHQANVPKAIDSGFRGRGVPDVSGNADPSTGYKVLVDGEEAVIGGTSAVAPLMAGLIALTNEKKGGPVGFIQPMLYTNPAKMCRDILKGNNITTATGKGYKVAQGWDAVTGLGVLHKL